MERRPNPGGSQSSVRFFFVECKPALKPFLKDGVQVIPKRDFIESIRREVSNCLVVTNGLKLRKWDFGLLWKVPFLILSRPWRRKQLNSCEPDDRLAGNEVDIWFTFGCSANSARVIESARILNRPALLFVGSNVDIVAPQLTDVASPDKYGEKAVDRTLSLLKATKVVCQSEWQLDRLRTLHRIEGVLVRNPIDLHLWRPHKDVPRKGVLWIGRYDDFHKRVNLAIEIAKRCPDISFKLIANPGDSQVENWVRHEAVPNVTLIDYVPSETIIKEFISSAVFLSTGSPEYEGFPNVLLQASATETPIVSLHDFDGFLDKSKAGFACNGNIDIAVEKIERILASEAPIDWVEVSRYLEKHHSSTAVRETLLHVLEEFTTHPNCNGIEPETSGR